MDVYQELINYILTLPVVVFDREEKFIFFGNRKAGLHSVCRHHLKDRAVLRKDFPGDWKRLADSMLGAIHQYFKFTVIRNPFDRAVSAFHALQQYSKKWPGMEFKTFVKTELAAKGYMVNEHFFPQYPNVYFKKLPMLDFVARLENIERDFEVIADVIGCDPNLPWENRSRHEHYSTYYDEESRAIVESIYKLDIDLFGYQF